MPARILVVSKLMWPDGGGAELATRLIVERLVAAGARVAVASGSPRPGWARGLPYYWIPRLRGSPKPIDWLLSTRPPRLLRRLLEWADTLYLPGNTLLPLATVARRLGTRVVVHLHNLQPVSYTSVLYHGVGPWASDLWTEALEHGLAYALAVAAVRWLNPVYSRIPLASADAVVCASRLQCRIILEHVPEARGRGLVAYNPPPPLPGDPGGWRGREGVVFPGGGSVGKGVHVVLRAAPRIVRTAPPLRIVGGRPFTPRAREALERLSRATGGRIIVTGRLEYREYTRLVSSSRALLLPSIWVEPLPYSAVEALLLGTPVILSSHVGLAELLEGTRLHRLIVPPGDPGALADAVEEAVSMGPAAVDAALEAGERVVEAMEEGAARLVRLLT